VIDSCDMGPSSQTLIRVSHVRLPQIKMMHNVHILSIFSNLIFHLHMDEKKTRAVMYYD